jgi:predicted ATPase/DNA-binding CsgD family transcriptional regulator
MAQTVLAGQVAGLRRPGLLPAETNSFAGRAGELLWLAGQLRSARLITVVGPGGVGKTRLCLRVAASLPAGRFPDGTRIAALSDVSDATLLYDKVAVALGLPALDPPSQRAAVLEHLRDRRLLLILDTCERLVDGCAAFAEAVLRAAPGVTVLATSRQPFDAPGEQAFPLAPMPVETDAVELFAQRAASVLPEFSVTAANRADVVRLCRRLDGLPLAIELAAVRLRALPLAELADHLEAGFSLLDVARRGGSARHQTLRNAIEWSHALCTPAERALWARLSVFAGPFDVAAAEAVCADQELPRDEVVHALIGLVDKSVVLRSDGAGQSCGGGSLREKRYRVLGTVREFGSEQLARTGQQARFLDRLTEHYLALAARFDAHLLTDDQPGRLRQLRAEHANVQAALQHSLDDRDSRRFGRGPASAEQIERWRRGGRLAVTLHAYWQMSGLLTEGRHHLDQALLVCAEPSPERALAFGLRGRLAALQGDPASAADDIRQSIRLAEELGADRAAARGYLDLNLALVFAGKHEQAVTAGLTARQRMTASDDRAGLIYLEPQLAYLHLLAGNADAALGCCQRGQARLTELSPRGQERWITGQLQLLSGLARYHRPGPGPDCAAAIRRALQARHDFGDEAGMAWCLEVLGWVAARGERFDQAARLLGTADGLWRRSGRRLSGIAALEQVRQQVVSQARAALGDGGYHAAYALGGELHLDTVVLDALDDRADAGSVAGERVAGERAVGQRGPAAPPSERATPPSAADSEGPGDGSPLTTAPTAAPTAAALTRREREIAVLVANGLSNREIATRLFISKRTVDAHVEHIFAKLEISSRVKLTLWLRSQARSGA